jgi:hypothetical protein
MYKTLRMTIIKADLLRYLVMYINGGTYADIDVEALKSIDAFISPQFKEQEKDIDMVVGVEIDQPHFYHHSILGRKSESFVQWTFMCKPKLPVMLRLIDNIITWLNRVAYEQNVPVSDIQLDFDQVISGTGPSAFTVAVLAEMSRKHGSAVSWDNFHNMAEPKVIGGVLVLTIEAFAAGQGHSNSGDHDSEAAMVKHHYHASLWPLRHPRYNHPVYGTVEICNWEADCVSQWDANTEAFKKLDPEVQAQMIAEKEAADEEAEEKEAALKEAVDKEAADLKSMEEELAQMKADAIAEKAMDAHCQQLIQKAKSKGKNKSKAKGKTNHGSSSWLHGHLPAVPGLKTTSRQRPGDENNAPVNLQGSVT